MGTIADHPDWEKKSSRNQLITGVDINMGFSQGQLYKQEILCEEPSDLPLALHTSMAYLFSSMVNTLMGLSIGMRGCNTLIYSCHFIRAKAEILPETLQSYGGQSLL